MKSLVTFLFVIFATSLISGCSTPMMRKANMACKVIYGIKSLIDSKDDSNTDVDWNQILKESERYEDITR
jgi:endo-beta-N-acetylglucosaminidase D